MPDYLAKRFSSVNNHLDNAKARAAKLATDFTTARPRIEVVEAHRTMRNVIQTFVAARGMTGMAAYAVDQWGNPALDFIAKAQAIEAAADAVAVWIEANFPTVQTVVDSAMDAAGVPTPQQDALRAELGVNLDYLMINKIEANVVMSPTIPAAALAPLVVLLNDLVTAATL